MRRVVFCLLLLAVVYAGAGQPVRQDTLARGQPRRLQVGAFIDTYWGYHSSRPAAGDIAYFVSSARHNQFNVNLAYADIRYGGRYLRARVVPAAGTFMKANFAHEPATWRHLLEANVGVLLHRRRNIWVDAGVLGSPYTNETAVSKDHLMYTRSFAPEYVPYYLSGIRLSVPLHKKWTTQWYLLTGWQVIRDKNHAGAFGSQVSFRPNPRTVLNWNIFAGDERSAVNPDFRVRVFSDINWVYKSGGRWDATACIYGGAQRLDGGPAHVWWQANAAARFTLSARWSVSGRVEYF